MVDALPRLPRRVHLLGVGGAGVSGIARILAARGHAVSGHDRAPSTLLATLAPLGLALSLGESDADFLPSTAEIVVRSAAVPDDDPQVLAARARGVEVIKYAEALARIAPPGRTLAVAGTHGKTSTAWLLFHALSGLAGARGSTNGAAARPGALIGGLSRDLATNALAGDPNGWFVAEACEYDRSFHALAPHGAVVTNVEPEHLDCFGSFEAVVEAFATFAGRVAPDGLLVVGADVPAEVERAARCGVWRAGRELDVGLFGERSGCFEMALTGPGFETPVFPLAVPGRFQVDNAALACALALGLAARDVHGPREVVCGDVAAGLAAYRGTARRFEPWGSAGGIDVVHDYAHHPTEVRVTIEAARRVFPGRPVHVLFQPHQHSRTARFLDDFAESLRGADRVVVADVYGARRPGATERLAGAPELVAALKRRRVAAEAGGTKERSVEAVSRGLQSGAALLVLGAGDVEQVRDELLEKLALCGALGREPLR